MSTAAPWLSIVIPVYNEEASLEALHRALDAALAVIDPGVEIVWVDDGSEDASLERMQELATKDPRVRILALDRNHGQSAALDAGFRAARGEVVATLDADLQNDPRDLARLLDRLEDADVVNGVRIGRSDGLVRRISSVVANRFRNWATQEQVSDVGCSLRVMRARFLRRIRLFDGAHRFLPTLLRMEGARAIEVPVSHRMRRHGASKYNIRNRLFVGLVDTLLVRWMLRRRLRYRSREWATPGR